MQGEPKVNPKNLQPRNDDEELVPASNAGQNSSRKGPVRVRIFSRFDLERKRSLLEFEVPDARRDAAITVLLAEELSRRFSGSAEDSSFVAGLTRFPNHYRYCSTGTSFTELTAGVSAARFHLTRVEQGSGWFADMHVLGLTEVSFVTLVPMVALLEWKSWLLFGASGERQIIFCGPSGTGKTWLAKHFAQELLRTDCEKGCVGDMGECAECLKRLCEVQFSETYSYTQFIGGAKVRGQNVCTSPGVLYELLFDTKDFDRKDITASSSGFGLRLKHANCDGSVRNACMVIDEINRGKTSSIFGEALQSLEYRDKIVKAASGFEFGIPKQFFLIGTMNNEDKSLFPMDRALMERFRFVDLLDFCVESRAWQDTIGDRRGTERPNEWPNNSLPEFLRAGDALCSIPRDDSFDQARFSECVRKAERASIMILRALRCALSALSDEHWGKLKKFASDLSHINWFLVRKFDNRKEIELGHARFLSIISTEEWRTCSTDESRVTAFLKNAEIVLRRKVCPILSSFFPWDADLGRVEKLLRLVAKADAPQKEYPDFDSPDSTAATCWLTAGGNADSGEQRSSFDGNENEASSSGQKRPRSDQ